MHIGDESRAIDSAGMASTSLYVTVKHLGRNLRSGNFLSSRNLASINPESHNLRAEAMGCLGRLTVEDINHAILQSDLTCFWCRDNVSAENLTIDHVLPLSRGGPNIRENICVACSCCNCSKRDMHPLNFASKDRRSEVMQVLLSISSYTGDVGLLPSITEEPHKDKLIRVAYLDTFDLYGYFDRRFNSVLVETFRQLPFDDRLFVKMGASGGMGTYRGCWLSRPEHFQWVNSELLRSGRLLDFILVDRTHRPVRLSQFEEFQALYRHQTDNTFRDLRYPPRDAGR